MFDFSPLRQSNIYSGIFGNGMDLSPQDVEDPYANLFESQPMVVPQQGNLSNIANLMNQYYTPETEASDRFNQMIQAYPEYQEPSTLRKIGASIMGMGAHHNAQMQDSFLNRKRNQEVEDWKNQINPAMQAANLERYNNANERTLAYQMSRSDLENRKLEEKTKTDEANIDIRRQRADVYEWKAKHPESKVFKQPGGNVYLVDPISGESFDTGLSSGEMTDKDKITLSGSEARKTVVTRGTEARKTKSTPSGSSSSKGESPTQIKVKQYNLARELANTRPDLQKFIHLGDPGTNDFQVDSPSDGFFGHSGPTKEQYEEIKGKVYGNLGSNTSSSSNERVRVTSPDGRTGTIPANKLDAALKAGWKRM